MKILAAAAMATCLVAPAWALPERACSKNWAKADANHDQVVTGVEAAPYLAAIRRDGRIVPDDGRIGRPLFMHQCRVGVYSADPGDLNAPLSEAQAKSRAAAAGYPGITDMVKDADGIWRGTATIEGRTVGITIDATGDVATKPIDPVAPRHDLAPRPWGLS